MHASNWLIGLLLLSIMSIKLLWGLDLWVAAHLRVQQRWRVLLTDGAWYLGMYFVLTGLFVYGAIGYLLLHRPHETVPMWFAVPCILFTIDAILAWHFLPEDDASGGDVD